MHLGTLHERPLTPLAKAGLITSTASVIVTFYFLALIAVVVLLALLAFELLLVLGAARIGLAGWMARIMEAHVRLLGILFRSLWLRSAGAEYRIALSPADAPQLFKILNALCGRFGIKEPEKVQLEMGVSAWAQLKGYRTGAGKTRLGLGYDLLCGLTVSEVEAVIAHEMAHAKLVQRGFKRFATSALNRCAALVNTLTTYVRLSREAGADHTAASMLLGPFDVLIGALARFVAAYSRQDEFEADRGAAEICGPNSIRSSLLKLDAIEEASSRLSWRERVAQLQSGAGFTEWFGREMAANLVAPGENRLHLFDKYATHPSLPDRLEALPPDVAQELNTAAGVTLLAAPDAIAERLVEEIHRVAAIEEEKDREAVAKWACRQFRARTINWKHMPGLIVCIAAGIVIIYGLIEWRDGLVADFVGAAMLAAGILLTRLGRYRDPRALAIPEYSKLVEGARRKPALNQQDAMLRELEQKTAAEKGRKRRVNFILDEAYSAVESGDYLRAHVAARVAFKQKKGNVEAHLAYAVAAASVNEIAQAVEALQFVQYHTGFLSPSTAWSAAWVFTLIGEPAGAEAMLERLLQKNPDQKTFLALLAIVRSQRNKTNSAIVAARQACTPSPPSKEHALLLARLLIDAGLLREASGWLDALARQAPNDLDVQFQRLRFKLLKREFDSADLVAQRLLEADHKPERFLGVAGLYHQARRFDVASAHYSKVLDKGFYPEALVGLGEIAAEQRDKPKAREQLLAALNLRRPLGEDAAPPGNFFQRVMARMFLFEEPEHCSAWVAFLPANAGTTRCHDALINLQYLVFAPTEMMARNYLHHFLVAADPQYPTAHLVWAPARKDQQPVRPVRPGVQRISPVAAR